MNWRNTTLRDGSVSVGLHWLMLPLNAAVYACIELRRNLLKGSDIREGLKDWHFVLGWLTLSAGGEPFPFFGLHLPPLIGESKPIAEWAEEIHEAGGTIG
jgi:superoxide oxidase